jgi:RimJ/RimL family protein N-acetyltransferase
MTELRTRTLTLRLCDPSDRDDFIALERDPEVMHFLNGGAVDHATMRSEDVSFLMPRGEEPYVWTARRSATGSFIGWFCLFAESETRAEIGYRLRREEWGQGLASEGATALVDWGFATAGFHEIVACTAAVNHGSRRVMEKIGMTHVRTDLSVLPADLPGAEHGEVWYEVQRADWNRGKRQAR